MKALVENTIFSISSKEEFISTAFEIFRYQAVNNDVYAKYLKYRGIDYKSVNRIDEIPFMPISFFKDLRVVCGKFIPEATFLSSGTSNLNRSSHYIKHLALYERSFTECFKLFYGEPSSYAFLALLPSYLERDGSSLVYMAKTLIRKSCKKESGFYLDDFQGLNETIKELKKQSAKIILFGVSFALLDFAEKIGTDLSDVIIIETGGMKGRRKELVREELHNRLKVAFNTNEIHSEYGMTELLSQAYSKKDGLFFSPPWMKVMIRDHLDPGVYVPVEVSGGLNIIDLANIHSCSFIETSDLGKIHKDGGFEILGRFDNSDIRGCNLLVEQI